jgi:hypothetical protein
MAIEVSNLTFTEQDDIVPESGVEQIVNTGIANTLAGNDTITGTGSRVDYYSSLYRISNTDTFNTGEGDDVITGTAIVSGFINTGTFNTDEGDDIITADGLLTRGLKKTGTFNTGEGDDVIPFLQIYATVAIADRI